MGNWGFDIDINQLEDVGQYLFGYLDNVLLPYEAHLHVQLSELGLTISAEVLVPVAAGNLIVAFHPRHHQ